MEIKCNDKAVTIRERFPTKTYWSIVRSFRGVTGDSDWQEIANALMPFVESWEFDGDPQNVEAWGELDLFSETMPIMDAVSEMVTRKSANAKN